MSVCVAISVLDGEAYLARAIESALAQEGVELEVRVYDNGSGDRSLEIARSYLGDGRVEVVRNERDLNYYGSLNRALDETEADFFVPFAADDVMLPGNLSLKISALEEHAAAFAHGPRFFVDERGARTALPGGLDGIPLYSPGHDFLRANVPFNLVATPTVLARTDALRAIGGFDARCVYCADWLAWMLMSLDDGVVTVPEPLVEQRIHERSGTRFAAGQGYFARDLPAALLRVLEDPRCPPSLAARRAELLGQLYTYCAVELAKGSHVRLAAGWAAYAYAGLALAEDPRRYDRVAPYVELTAGAGLAVPELPLDAVAAAAVADAGAVEDLARAGAALHGSGLLGRLSLAVDADAIEAARPVLERAFASVPSLPVDIVPGAAADLLRPGRVLLAPLGDRAAIAAAEDAGIPAFPHSLPSPFSGPPDRTLRQTASPPRRAPKQRPEGFWRDRPVLVTGATGLLGSWLTAALHTRGARVVALVRDLVPDSLFYASGFGDRVVTVFGDVCDGRLLERVLVEHEIDAVFHLAAQTIVEHAQRDPANTLRANVEGTWELLDACRRSRRPTRVVVASSDKAYGDQPVLPYTETTPLQGRNPYDVSKSCADLVTQMYAAAYDLPTVVTRCGNLYGGGDLNFNRLVPGTIRAALRGESPVLRSNGRGLRDYLYVEDAVEAYVALAERAHEPGIAGEAWNFSTESPLSTLEMTHAILHACGRRDLVPDVRGTATHEIQDQYLSAEKARRELGWVPRFGLEAGLERTAAWYRSYLDGFDPERPHVALTSAASL